MVKVLFCKPSRLFPPESDKRDTNEFIDFLRKDNEIGITQDSVISRPTQEEIEVLSRRAIALNFLRDGLSVEAIARGTGLSIEEVQQLQQQLNGSAQS